MSELNTVEAEFHRVDRRPLRTAAVVGTGLIGTSVGLALSARGVTTYLLDRDPEVAREAAALGAGRAARPPHPVDLAVLAMPPSAIPSALIEYQRSGLAHYFTDVGSVKLPPQRTAATAGADLRGYVGGHPMAGAERSGPSAARADLFHGRTWVLTPSARTDPAAVARASELIRLCGAELLLMDAAEHDRTVALTSHAPHLLASLIAGRLADTDPARLRLAGAGLRDTTRIALGDPDLWTDILRSNAAPVAEVLREVADELAVAVAALDWLAGPDPAQQLRGERELHHLLSLGVAGRERLPAAAAQPAGR
ncbi:prephenate dehydrogenase [Kitasatospora viridis]|uniref:Prephenate dehydrogenase n=1 Tax=Kitasatospora viridis TaxID=281105 RepID=A0A561UIS2_9ACTN|nr:prephenate dehydrogenase [Kitasatospora viridis]TWF99255.1 prephenate dehydrogenase [Kitasatospora viridis]